MPNQVRHMPQDIKKNRNIETAIRINLLQTTKNQNKETN